MIARAAGAGPLHKSTNDRGGLNPVSHLMNMDPMHEFRASLTITYALRAFQLAQKLHNTFPGFNR